MVVMTALHKGIKIGDNELCVTFNSKIAINDHLWPNKSQLVLGSDYDGTHVLVDFGETRFGEATISTGRFIITVFNFDTIDVSRMRDRINKCGYHQDGNVYANGVDILTPTLRDYMKFLDRELHLVDTIDVSKYSSEKCVTGVNAPIECTGTVRDHRYDHGLNHIITAHIEMPGSTNLDNNQYDKWWYRVVVSHIGFKLEYYVHGCEVDQLPIYMFLN